MAATMTTAAPARSIEQRMEALEKANSIRSHRARVKKDVKHGAVTLAEAMVDESLATMRIYELLIKLPKFGRVKANRVLNRCRISQSKTVGGLTDRQRGELLVVLNGLGGAR